MINEMTERAAIETMRVTAKMLHEFYTELIVQGFTGGEAMYFATEWLKNVLKKNGA